MAQIGSWRLDVRRDALTWCDETHRIFGIPSGTPLSYEKFLATVHPEDREYVDRQWTAALKGEPYDIEHRIVVGDTIKWVRELAELEFDSQGLLLGGFGTAQDITERKQGRGGAAPEPSTPGPAGGVGQPAAGQLGPPGSGGRHLPQGDGISGLRRVFQFSPG